MSDTKNLESLYNSELKPRLSKLDNQRVGIVNKIKKFNSEINFFLPRHLNHLNQHLEKFLRCHLHRRHIK